MQPHEPLALAVRIRARRSGGGGACAGRAEREGIGEARGRGEATRTSLWRWQYAYAHGGLAALAPAPHGPRHPQLKHSAWLEQVVIAVRLHTYWNAKRISAELRRREIAWVGQWWIERLFDDIGNARR